MKTNQIVPVMYDPNHSRHAPFFEYDRGKQIPYQEVPRRIEATKEALTVLSFTHLIHPCELLPETAITAVHSKELLNYLQSASNQAREWQEEHPEDQECYLTPWIYPLNPAMRQGLLRSPDSGGCFAFDLYAPIGANTWNAVLGSANLAYQAARLIINGSAPVVYALCRPPGHHTGADYTGGYCYLNNAAIAAKQLAVLGPGTIFDIDYHHGNGTQDIFWNDPSINYVSIHADPRQEYPFFAGFADETGGENAPGSNRNIPLPMYTGDEIYLAAVDQAVEYIRDRGSRWVVLSAGFDTCTDDQSTSFQLTDAVYSAIGKKIAMLNIPMVIVHEGGYAVEKNGSLAARLLCGITGV